MRTSINGMIAILKSEAIVLSSYDDGTGVMTIGVGHTANAGLPVPNRGLKLTLRQALQIFMRDLAMFERGVSRAIDKVPMLQHEFDGFVGFHFNTGQIEKGTVDDKWERGDKAGAMKTLKAYKKARGKVLGGLVARRKEEEAIIMHAEYPRVSHILVAQGWDKGKPIGLRHVPVDEIAAVLRELLQPATAQVPVAPAEKSEPAQMKVETPETPGAGKAVAGGIAGGITAGAAAAANGIHWTWILGGAGIVAAILLIALLIAKRKQT
jgi:GH24 family phage-related lysozyme (muramidase)